MASIHDIVGLGPDEKAPGSIEGTCLLVLVVPKDARFEWDGGDCVN